ncbi:MAG TPA: ribosome maturation factor RimM [Pilimelia sp.]|nr:ribosome maturation factor RimM [Pilimelia sp.]
MQLIVGRVVRPHGIRGEVIVEVRTDEPEARFFTGAALATDVPAPARASAAAEAAAAAGASAAGAPAGVGETRWSVPDRLTIEAVRSHQGRLIVGFEGVSDRDVAEALRGVLLCVDSADVAPPTDPDEFLDHQLVGLRAVTPAGETLGEVARIDHAPAADLLVLRRSAGGTALVPFVKAIVPEVDLAGGRVVVDPPEGLLEL